MPVRRIRGKRQTQRLVALVALVLIAAALLRTAWVSDDALITLRTVLNTLHGYGAGFNAGERVQAYTHPAWFLLLLGATATAGNVFVAALTSTGAITLAVAWILIARVASGPAMAGVAAAALLFSKAFVDYGTSGLENPLSHLLLLALLALAARATGGARRPLAGVYVVGALVLLTRPDHAFLAGPLALMVAVSNRTRPARLAVAVAAGGLLLAGWAAFATFYYGNPLPNTVLAKLGFPPPLGERAAQGLAYLAESLIRDPVTLGVILLGAAAGWARGDAVSRAAAAGIALHLGWLLWIGGDFMTGRMLTPPFVLALALAVARPAPPAAALVFGAGLLAAGISSAASNLLPVPPSPELRRDRMGGIADERAVYAPITGLFTAPLDAWHQPAWTIGLRSTRITCGELGLDGLRAGPGLHIIDYCALADPLLARMPPRFEAHWRPGHAIREVPVGYFETVAYGGNSLVDPALSKVYDVVRSVTRGPLLDPGRLSDVRRLVTGDLPAIDLDRYRYNPVVVDQSDIRAPVDFAPFGAPGVVRFPVALEIGLGDGTPVARMQIALDGNDVYAVEIRSGGSWARVAELGPTFPIGRQGATLFQARPDLAGGMVPYTVRLDRERVIDRIRILALSGDDAYGAGDLRLAPADTTPGECDADRSAEGCRQDPAGG